MFFIANIAAKCEDIAEPAFYYPILKELLKNYVKLLRFNKSLLGAQYYNHEVAKENY